MTTLFVTPSFGDPSQPRLGHEPSGLPPWSADIGGLRPETGRRGPEDRLHFDRSSERLTPYCPAAPSPQGTTATGRSYRTPRLVMEAPAGRIRLCLLFTEGPATPSQSVLPCHSRMRRGRRVAARRASSARAQALPGVQMRRFESRLPNFIFQFIWMVKKSSCEVFGTVCQISVLSTQLLRDTTRSSSIEPSTPPTW